MIEVDIEKPKRQKTIEAQDDDVFRILILGDFGAEDIGRPVLVDRDNVEEVMEKWKVRAAVPIAGAIPFRTIDDFHPDHLYRRLQLFKALRDARDRLEDPETYRQTAEQIFNPAAPQPSMDILRPANLLDQAVEEASGGKVVDPFTDYLRQLVAPYTVPKPDPNLPEMLAEIDASISGNMRAILHHPDYQKVESAWRALDMLVRAVETSVDLKIYIMNLPQNLFQGDLVRAAKLKDTVLHSLLGAQEWNYVIAAYTFGDSELDVETLGRVALLMDHSKTRFLAAATPDFEKWQEPSPGLEEMKRLPEIRQVGLALPRWIARMPYGKKASSIDAFEFEEMDQTPKHEDYCWANPAFACARLLAGNRSTGEESLNIRDLATHLYKDSGETVAKPCAEFLMTQKTAERLTDAGLMPLISMKGQDWIRLAGFRALNGAAFVD